MSKTEAPPKPAVETIRAARPLTADRDQDPISCCNVCHLPSAGLGLWREHDERDEPIAGDHALVFIGKDHPRCVEIMERHPRLYAEESGLPGTFPLLCGGCAHRAGLKCRHPDLKENGGQGLRVVESKAIVCRRPRSASTVVTLWAECVGRVLRPRINRPAKVGCERCEAEFWADGCKLCPRCDVASASNALGVEAGEEKRREREQLQSELEARA